MILKFAGAGLILLASLGVVFSRESEFLEHKKQLEEFGMLLSLLQNEICLLRLPLVQVLEHCSMHLHNPYQSLCAAVSEQLLSQRQGEAMEIWREVLGERRGDFLLDDSEYQLLTEAGEVLRMGNVELKEELFSVYGMRLGRLQASFEESLVQRRRLSRYGTLLAGIFLIILFI